ncbi:MAG: flavodoxin family protein [Nevskiaceae bacterium]|nr:MAG: flavodoxin family protein [Nevskiaceae bacterium]TBR73655.1 MAG: flavodoxin family protein [Nevskiaceae bacterium]
MKTLLVVYHTRTGGTQQMVEAAVAQARGLEDGVRIVVQRAQDTQPEDLRAADGYLFAAPENLAALAGAMKEFFDRCYYPVLGQLNGRPYAAMICAGSDGTGAKKQLERIALGWRLVQVLPTPIVCTHAQTAERIAAPKHITDADRARCGEVGATLAVGMAVGSF